MCKYYSLNYGASHSLKKFQEKRDNWKLVGGYRYHSGKNKHLKIVPQLSYSITDIYTNVIIFKRGRRVLGGAARTADLLWNMSAWSLSVVPVRLSCALLD